MSRGIEQMTPRQRLTVALLLVLTAPSDALSEEASEVAEAYTDGLTKEEIDTCKSLALAFFHAGTDLEEVVG